MDGGMDGRMEGWMDFGDCIKLSTEYTLLHILPLINSSLLKEEKTITVPAHVVSASVVLNGCGEAERGSLSGCFDKETLISSGILLSA